jgi:hypothetical protein
MDGGEWLQVTKKGSKSNVAPKVLTKGTIRSRSTPLKSTTQVLVKDLIESSQGSSPQAWSGRRACSPSSRLDGYSSSEPYEQETLENISYIVGLPMHWIRSNLYPQILIKLSMVGMERWKLFLKVYIEIQSWNLWDLIDMSRKAMVIRIHSMVYDLDVLFLQEVKLFGFA